MKIFTKKSDESIKIYKLFILVCLAINHTQKNIAFPDNASDLREIKSKFHDIGKIPNCVGAVDGTLTPIKGMSGTDEPAYVCRKIFTHSIYRRLLMQECG